MANTMIAPSCASTAVYAVILLWQKGEDIFTCCLRPGPLLVGQQGGGILRPRKGPRPRQQVNVTSPFCRRRIATLDWFLFFLCLAGLGGSRRGALVPEPPPRGFFSLNPDPIQNAICHLFYLSGLSCPVLSCPVLTCPVLPCPVLPCPVLSCPACLFI